ncbi:helix-turn-helix transcriptional regulator [Cupriavidus sp. WKF15]|uniref:helix-turn-helix domain-containing protein n=1 Tax=Cupriavidus sp. WKF15 TaxID=3032282 RepID=UPI0023E27493|nr:helix-turn-helix transcriptional regulator [Cupriavidus sp. WKF15]WER45601.1 helix-turn-helix transcriptional regulator [Cupriavidus sp. WKF15]
MDDVVTQTSFADMLHFARRRSGVTQKDAASASGIDRSYLAALESGRRSPPGLTALHRILDAIRATKTERARIIYAAFCTRCNEDLSGLLPTEEVESLKELLFQLVRKDGKGSRLLTHVYDLPDDRVALLAEIADWPEDQLRTITGFARLPRADKQFVGTMVVALYNKEPQEI